jgi:hypothetical protein
MIHTSSFLRTFLLSITAFAGAFALTGCMDSSSPATGAVESAVINQPSAPSVKTVSEIQLGDHGAQVTSAGWTQTEPGIFTNPALPGANSIVAGAEGHARAIAHTEAQLASLRANGGFDDEIAQQEAYLAALHSAAANIAASADISPRVTCNIGFVFGPSSPVIPGFVGALAAAQLSCSVGTQVFTVQAQACTNLGCGPISVQTTPAIGATPMLFGTATAGTAGAACSGIVTVTPPGLTQSASGPCG